MAAVWGGAGVGVGAWVGGGRRCLGSRGSHWSGPRLVMTERAATWPLVPACERVTHCDHCHSSV